MAEEYFKLFFDDRGNLQDATQQTAIIDALVSSPKPVTDLWIFAYGWNNDLKSGTQTYDNWIARMREAQQRLVKDPGYNPLFVGIYWPSKAWDDTIVKPIATPSVPTSREAATGGGTGEFELGDDPHPQSEGISDSNKKDQNRFVADYRAVMDPEGIYGDDYDRDFIRLYTLMAQPQSLTDKEIREFVRILKKYETPDPHSDPLEKQNISSVSVEVVVNQLKEAGRYESFSGRDVLQKLFGASSFWKMKGRAAIVGENGVYRFLVDVKKALRQHQQQVRIHLLGHSFGAKLVTAAIYPATISQDIERPFINTLVLLQGAFSQFSFSSAIPVETGATGYYASVMERGVVANPIIVVYSRYDTANKGYYPLGMFFARPTRRYEQGEADEAEEMYTPSKNLFGALGANGAQGLEEMHYRAIDMLSGERSYDLGNLTGITCLNVDGQQFINHGGPPAGAHNDINGYEIFHLALALSLR